MPDPLRHGSFEVRFQRGLPEYLDLQGCWEWQKYCCPSTGYGRLADASGARKIGAHRASWLIHHGVIPDGLFVLHKCDNRKCVNPDHLFLGTHQDNMRDMLEKGRGSHPPRAKAGMTVEERRAANKTRMGKLRTECKRGHPLPPYGTAKVRKCYEPECREARRLNALSNNRKAIS